MRSARKPHPHNQPQNSSKPQKSQKSQNVKDLRDSKSELFQTIEQKFGHRPSRKARGDRNGLKVPDTKSIKCFKLEFSRDGAENLKNLESDDPPTPRPCQDEVDQAERPLREVQENTVVKRNTIKRMYSQRDSLKSKFTFKSHKKEETEQRVIACANLYRVLQATFLRKETYGRS